MLNTAFDNEPNFGKLAVDESVSSVKRSYGLMNATALLASNMRISTDTQLMANRTVPITFKEQLSEAI